jgi:predicted HicB family RNase H-like nuclease
VFYDKIEGTNNLITFEGDSIRKLKTAFIDAVADYSFLRESKKSDKF